VPSAVAAGLRMERITRYYASIYAAGAPYFDVGPPEAVGMHGVRYGRWSFLYTMASMVIAVNSVAGGAAIALVFALAVHAAAPIPVVLGICGGLILLLLSLLYEHRRLTPVVLTHAVPLDE
jgi:hypothetical protein